MRPIRPNSENLFSLGKLRPGAAGESTAPLSARTMHPRDAVAIGEVFADQDFSIVDRTSFAVMERLGITRVASFDDHFAIYRYGRARNKAFEVVR
jgi:predicted nucleic acid-binding protein